LKPWIGHGVRSFSHSGTVCTRGISTSSSGGSSSAAATRNTTDVWYIAFRGDFTGKVCATVAASVRTTNVIQPCLTLGAFR
jgi:hypothetical protein